MQLIYWTGPNNGRWSGTIRCAEGNVQLNNIPGSKVSEIEKLVREFGDAQEALPPTQAAGVEFVETLGTVSRKQTGNALPVFIWQDEVAAEPKPKADQKPKAEAKPKAETKPKVAAEPKPKADQKPEEAQNPEEAKAPGTTS